MTGRSGNLGDCSQACRFEYEIKARNHGSGEIVEEENGTYILNSKDLCLIRYLDRLAQAGVSSFKIEGRAKSVYYQSLVSGSYRRAIDSLVLKGGAEFRRITKLETN
jgi:putative protease